MLTRVLYKGALVAHRIVSMTYGFSVTTAIATTEQYKGPSLFTARQPQPAHIRELMDCVLRTEERAEKRAALSVVLLCVRVGGAYM